VEPIICPSCGSKYNSETHELVEDTKLKERIAQLETEADVLRRAAADLRFKLETAQARLDVFDAPKPKARDFIVGCHER
jgi:hypothetical protein